MHTHMNRPNSYLLVRFSFSVVILRFTVCVKFSFMELAYLRMCAFIVLDLVSSVLCQDIGWEECLRNDLFCVERDIKTLTQSISQANLPVCFHVKVICKRVSPVDCISIWLHSWRRQTKSKAWLHRTWTGPELWENMHNPNRPESLLLNNQIKLEVEKCQLSPLLAKSLDKYLFGHKICHISALILLGCMRCPKQSFEDITRALQLLE